MQRISFRILLFIAIVLPAAAVPAWAETAAGPERLSLWEMLRQGGWAMYPLALCSMAMFALIFYGALETRRRKFVPDTVLPQIGEHLGDRDINSAVGLLQAAPTVLSRSMEPALLKARPNLPDANKPSVEDAFSEMLDHEENNVAQWIQYLNVIATVAPMIGLLGTVSGMIGAFQTISFSGMGRPELFAGDIGEALVTTATGLVIGIPAMIAFFVLRNRLDNAMLLVSQNASTLIDRLAGEEIPLSGLPAKAPGEGWVPDGADEAGSTL